MRAPKAFEAFIYYFCFPLMMEFVVILEFFLMKWIRDLGGLIFCVLMLVMWFSARHEFSSPKWHVAVTIHSRFVSPRQTK